MSRARLSGLDASFLALETPTAHMHVGWVAIFAAAADGGLPDFSQLRAHIEGRIGRAPRYRQKLARVPLGLTAPEWVDDEDFSIERHLYQAPGPLPGLVDEVMSMPLRRGRPLWELWVCEEPDSKRFAVIGKAHHCMVDGIAAVELGSMLLDPTPECGAAEEAPWRPGPEPGGKQLLLRGLLDGVVGQLGLVRMPVRAALSPARAARQGAAGAIRVAKALGHSLGAAAPPSALNQSLSPLRHLAWAERPLADLRTVKGTYHTTLNDVMLAAVAGGIRTYLADRGERPAPLKAMVPVSLRSSKDELGNHTSFVFAELPCHNPEPLSRLSRVHETMSALKRDREPEGADLALKAAEHTPVAIQHAISKLMASPRTFNLVVSNIPGPPQPLYLRGCPLQAIYPVVPLADRHTVSVGMTTVAERACFGVYADREAFPDAERLARSINEAITELLESAQRSGGSG